MVQSTGSVPTTLHVVTRAQRRGAELAACHLNAQLTRRGRLGEVVALGPVANGDAIDLEVMGPSPRALSSLRAVRRRARETTVVVAHGSATLSACALALAGGPPFVYLSIGDPRYWARTPGRRLRAAAAIRRASRVVALAPAAATALCEWYHLDAEKVRVLPNFRSADRFAPPGPERAAAARSALGLAEGRPVALMLGALTPEKRPLSGIRAAMAVAGLQVLVVGDGPLRPAVQEIADGQPGRVYAIGPTDDPRVALHAADVLVLSSASEGLPGVLVEAGLCGVPAAAPRVGWIDDVVVEAETGCLATPLDDEDLTRAIERVLSNRAELGLRARALCLSRFSDAAVLPGWMSLLDEVSRDGPGRRP